MTDTVTAGGIAAARPDRHDRFPRLEPADDDFPFYNGLPVSLTPAHWALVLSLLLAGFLLLVSPPRWLEGTWSAYVPAFLFCALPMAGLALAAPTHWRAIFRAVGPRDIGWMFAFGWLNVVVSFTVGVLITLTVGTSPNAATAGIEGMAGVELAAFFSRTFIQLFGEELFTILPFLAVMTYAWQHTGLSRRHCILLAWFSSAILFGLAHLPTYNWNLLQCLLVIGTARIVLTLAYIKTRNLWVAMGAHVISDWTLFTLMILLSKLR